MANNGNVAIIGTNGGQMSFRDGFPLGRAVGKNLHVHGIQVGSGESFRNMLRFLDQHRLRPHVGRVVPYDRAGDAFDAMRAQTVVGNICVAVKTGSASKL